MVKVNSASVRAAREALGLSERRLAASYQEKAADVPVSGAKGKRGGTWGSRELGTVRAYIRRLERREGDHEMSAEEAAALAAALEVEPEHLDGQLLWHLVVPAGGYIIAESILAFSQVEEARRVRDLLKYRRSPEAEHVDLAPTSRRALTEGRWPEYLPLRLAGGAELGLDRPHILIDPSENQVRAALILEDLLLGRPPESVQEYLPALAADFNLMHVRFRLATRMEVAERAGDRAGAEALGRQLDNLAAVWRAVDEAFIEGMAPADEADEEAPTT